MNNCKYDLLIAGAGGQGTILASKIISRVALAQDLEVKTAETHGMAQRGGSVVTHVRIGSRVYSPLIPLGDADFLLSFEQLEALRWLPYLSSRGTVITADLVMEPLPVLTGREEYPADALEQIKKAA
ncbi:MAG TPA: indolepyruvate oxidoreductase subunit beta, partial [Bacillota bacterium]|nr:indolepyruvate oxidoreductase subunit beta [Bacillota bacterium]